MIIREITPITIRDTSILGENMHGRREHELDYLSELRDWVHHVISEAEKNKDFEKKERFLRLLKDLDGA